MIQKLWASEPVVLTVLGSAAFWPAFFQLLAAYGHPVTDAQQHAWAAFGVVVAGIIIRSQVSPKK